MNQKKLSNISKFLSKGDFFDMIKSNELHFSNRKETMFSQHQRLELDQQEAVDHQINQLRDEQIRITEKSKLAMNYMKQILNLGRKTTEANRFEQLRIYHKWLDFRLR